MVPVVVVVLVAVGGTFSTILAVYYVKTRQRKPHLPPVAHQYEDVDIGPKIPPYENVPHPPPATPHYDDVVVTPPKTPYYDDVVVTPPAATMRMWSSPLTRDKA